MAAPGSTLGAPGDAGVQDDFGRPPRYGMAAGVRGVASVQAGAGYRAHEREARGTSSLGVSGFPLAPGASLSV